MGRVYKGLPRAADVRYRYCDFRWRWSRRCKYKPGTMQPRMVRLEIVTWPPPAGIYLSSSKSISSQSVRWPGCGFC
jgi:hypothetical protein